MTSPQAVPAPQGTRCAWCHGGIEADEPRLTVREKFIVCGPSCAARLDARLVRSGAQQQPQQQQPQQQQPTSRRHALSQAVAQRLAELAKPAAAAATAAAAAPSPQRLTAWSVWRTLATACGKDVTLSPPAGRQRRWREEDS